MVTFPLLSKSFSVWCGPNYLFFAFTAFVFLAKSNNLLPALTSRKLTLFSSRVFIASGFILTFNLFLVEFINNLPSFFYMCLSSFPNTIYWRDYYFPIVCSWFLCQTNLLYMGGLIIGSWFCFADFLFVFMPLLLYLHIMLIFSLKNQLLVLMIFSIIFVMSIKFISIFILVMSFFLLALG